MALVVVLTHTATLPGRARLRQVVAKRQARSSSTSSTGSTSGSSSTSSSSGRLQTTCFHRSICHRRSTGEGLFCIWNFLQGAWSDAASLML